MENILPVDDPAPAAIEIAEKLELWVAGRDFARIHIDLGPSFAALMVDGQLFAGALPVFYAYSEGLATLRHRPPAFPQRVDVDFVPGDRKRLAIKLDPLSTGQATVDSDPPGAKIAHGFRPDR